MRALRRLRISSLICLLLLPVVGLATTFEYDDLGRLTQVTYINGTVVTYEYDPAGNRTEHRVQIIEDAPINDSIPTLGTGPNLIDLANWPTGSAPSGDAIVTGWSTSSTYYDEAKWSRVSGPGASGNVTAMDVGQTDPDASGGGTNRTNTFTIDETKGYEFSVYFKKYDLVYQSLYFGTTTSSPGYVKRIYNNTAYTNPYFISWSPSGQATYLDEDKWYKMVAYVLPEGYPIGNNSDFGGIYEVDSGNRITDVTLYRWNEDRPVNDAYARFFTFYNEAQQDTFTNYFYQPEIRLTNISFTPLIPALSITHSNANEGSNITYNVNLSATTTVDTKVDYVIGHPGGTNSATTGDYTASSNTLVIPAGSTQGSILVVTTADGDVEADERIVMTLSNPVRATISESSEEALILNDDVPPSFSINNVSVTEGSTLTFTVTKTGSAAQSYSVNYATTVGTASTSDYTAASGTLTFATAETTKTVNVTTTQDSNYENNETLNVNLSAATGGATISDSQGVGTINNNDSAPSFSVNSVSVTEGGTLSFTVTKVGSTALSHNVSYATTDGSAIAGSDYTTASGVLTFTSGQTSKNVSVVTSSDSSYENNETVNLNLSSATADATISDSQGTGTINNNDSAPSFSVNNVSVTEGGTLSFTVTKAGLTALSHNVSYATTDGSAVAGSDYTTASGSLTFTSGQTSKTVSVITSSDSSYENNETVNLNLSSPTSGATISDSQGVGTINNNDTAPSFSVNNVSVTEGGTLSFTVTKSGASSFSHNVSYATANGTASSNDYSSASGTLTFTSAQSSRTVNVVTTQDGAIETNETVNLNLSSATAGATISDSQGIGTIITDEINIPPVAANDSAGASINTMKIVSVLSNDTDADGHTLTITGITGSTTCAIQPNLTQLGCIHNAPGTFVSTYTVSDGFGGTDTATMTFTVFGGGAGK